MTDSPSIVPSRELVYQWLAEVWHEGTPVRVAASDAYLATCAAQWGANQELEAIMAELKALHLPSGYAHQILLSRRPKPPSLKEQAIEQLDSIVGILDGKGLRSDTIRQALEQLPND